MKNSQCFSRSNDFEYFEAFQNSDLLGHQIFFKISSSSSFFWPFKIYIKTKRIFFNLEELRTFNDVWELRPAETECFLRSQEKKFSPLWNLEYILKSQDFLPFQNFKHFTISKNYFRRSQDSENIPRSQDLEHFWARAVQFSYVAGITTMKQIKHRLLF